MSRSTKWVCVLFPIPCSLFPLSAAAETITWTGGAGTSSWHTAANWDLNRVPGTGDDVAIPDMTPDVNVAYSSSATSINSLTSAEAFALSGGTLTLAAASAINAAYTQSGGTLAGAGNLAVGGLFTWSDEGYVGGSGGVIANGGLLISNNPGNDIPRLVGSRTLVVPAGQTATWTSPVGDVIFSTHDSAAFLNNGTVNITAPSGGYVSHVASGQIVNNGEINKSTAGTFGIYYGTFNNNGAVHIDSGTLYLNTSGTHTGSFDGAGRLIFGGGAHTFNAGSSLTNSDVDFSGGDANFNTGAVYSVSGITTINNSSSDVTFNASPTINTLNLSGGQILGNAPIAVSGLFTWDDQGAVGGSGSLTANGGLVISNSPGNDIPLIRGSRTLVVPAGQTATWTSPVGDVVFSTHDSAAFLNNGTVNITAPSGGYVSHVASGQIVNNGEINKSTAGTFGIYYGMFNNNGAVHIDTGTLYLQTSGTHTGSFDGAGTLRLATGTHNFNAGSSLGNVEFAGATTNFNATVGIGSCSLFAGTLQGSGDIDVSGLFTWTDQGAVAGSGSLTANGGLVISNSPSNDIPQIQGTRTVIVPAGQAATWTSPVGDVVFSTNQSGTFVNNGTVNITAPSGDYVSHFATGQIVNNGVINKSSAGTFGIYYGTFNNNGAAHIDTGTLYLQTSGTHTGSFDGAGTLSLGGGTHQFTRPSTGLGSLEVLSGVTLQMILGGTTPGTFAQINITGHATLNGALNVTALPGFNAAACDELVILTYGTRTGGFTPAPTSFPAPGCVTLDPQFDNPAGTFKLVAVDDCDCDGTPDELQPGACCIGGTTCSISTPSMCLSAGGVPLGRCTPCPSQNAGIFEEPGGEIFVHVIGPPIQCAAAAAAEPCPAEPPVCPPGQPLTDPWVSPADPSMRHQFGVEGSPAIPADFFGPGSDPFTGFVQFEGEPLGMPEFGAADTLIERTADPFGPCDLPSATAVDVPIEITALSLRSVSPMTVTYGGVNPEDWDVDVDLSPTVTPPVGMLTATKTHCNGGTYTSTLHVQPRFTFTKVSDPGQVRVLDTGAEGIPHVTLVQTDPIGWVSEVEPALGVQGDACSDFHAGIDEANPRSSCDLDNDGTANACDNCPNDANIDQADADADDVGDLCDNCPYRANPDQADSNANNIGDACEPPFCNAPEDCNSNGTPDDCDVASGISPDCNTNAVPDECDPDCNANNRPDDCDIALGQGTGNRGQGSEVRSQPLDRDSLLGPSLRGIPSPDSGFRILNSELVRGQSSIVLSPVASTGPVGAYHTLTALVTDGGTPVMGALVTFEALSGPNSGTLGTDETDANGEATLAYVGASGEGTDQILASFFDGQATQSSNTVSRTWLGSLDCNFNGTPDECESVSAPAGTLLGGVSRKLHGGSAGACDIALNIAGRVQNGNVTSEPRQGGIGELRLQFDIPPGGPGTTPVAVHDQACPGGAQGHYQLYSGPSSIAASIEGAELVLVFTPALANARTYRITVGPEVTGVPCQSIEVRALAGDATGNGRVDAGDRSAVVGVWTGSGFSCKTDITRDGTTNAGDRSAVVGAWTNPAGNCAP